MEIVLLPLAIAVSVFLIFTKQQRKSITDSATNSVVAGLGIVESSATSALATGKVSNIADFIKEMEESGLDANSLAEGDELLKAVAKGDFSKLTTEETK